MDMRINQFKQSLHAKETQVGLFVGLPYPLSTELLAGTGFDVLLFDTEHASGSLQQTISQLQACAAYPVQAVVRVRDHDAARIKTWLDAGVQTLMAPMVDTAEQARELVKAVRYPPEGIRGVAPAMSRAAHWGAIKDYVHQANQQMCLILQIESMAGVAEAQAIIGTPGVDAIFIGPADLAASMGHLGHPEHPDVQKTIRDLIQLASTQGKAVGIYTADPVAAQAYQALGVSFLVVGVDTLLLRLSAEHLVARFKA